MLVSAAEKDEYICLWSARVVGMMVLLFSFMERRSIPVVWGEEYLRTRREKVSRIL